MKNLLPYLLSISLLLPTQEINAQFQNFKVFPNPFCQQAFIQFDIQQYDTLTLQFFNLNGQIVKTIFSQTPLPSGSYTINIFRDSLPQGIYLVSIKGIQGQQTNKILISGDCSPTNIIQPTPSYTQNKLMYTSHNNTLHFNQQGIKKITLLNTIGQVCYTVDTDAPTHQLPLFLHGTYFIQIQHNQTQTITTDKLIIQ